MRTRSTVELLHRRAVERPTARTLVSRRWDLTAVQVSGYVARLARVFRDAGINSGDLVFLACDNDLGFLVTFALEHIGAVSAVRPGPNAPTSPRASWVICDYPASDSGLHTILIDDAFMARLVHVAPLIEVSPIAAQSDVRHIYSSGTTGHPVAVPFTLEQIEERTRLAEIIWMPDRPFMSLITMASASGYLTACANLRSGETYFSPGTPLDNIELLRANNVSTVKASPAQLAALCEAAASDVGLVDLTWIEAAGAPLTVTLAKRLQTLAPNASLLNLYGSTEAGTVAIGHVDATGATAAATIVDSADVEIVDDADQPVANESVGFIRWRRPHQADRYVGSDRMSLRHGWFYPGDRGVRHDNGTLTLVGRSDNLVNIGGVKVQLELLDAALEAQTNRSDIAFFSAPSHDGVDQLLLAVGTTEQVPLEALTAAVAAVTDIPCAAVFTMDGLPRTTLGKVQRGVLRDAFTRARA